MNSADYWIDRLGLTRHPEGGWFRETYRAAGSIEADALPERYGSPRSFSTAIYFLLKGDERSHLHRLGSDEIWHFHAGSGVTIRTISPEGEACDIRLGSDAEAGERFQAIIPAGTWFGATVDDPASYTLVGCTVAPGFDFGDFEMGDRDTLLDAYPRHADLIMSLTRGADPA